MNQIIRRTALSNHSFDSLRYSLAQRNTYIAYIRGKRCSTEAAFFQEVSAALQFPSYFGENWAAFDECLCDLEWLHFDKLIIMVDDYSHMFSEWTPAKDLLMKYFMIAIEYWYTEGKRMDVILNN